MQSINLDLGLLEARFLTRRTLRPKLKSGEENICARPLARFSLSQIGTTHVEIPVGNKRFFGQNFFKTQSKAC